MRNTIKFRLIFLLLAIICFVAGLNLTPDILVSDNDKLMLGGISAVYFILLPMAYWYCIIKIGQQKLWKIIMVLSLSSLVARVSYPGEISHYFEFVMWLRYPIIVILLVIELYLIVSVIRGLLKVRKLKGDPRVGAVETYRDGDDKSLTIALIMASEATNWFYSVPWFSRNHPVAIANINLLSANQWHMWLMIFGCIGGASISYMLLQAWSELVAIVVSTVIAYTLMSVVANHRLSRYYSLYILRNKLVINNSLWGFMVIDVADIENMNMQQQKNIDINEAETLCIGRGQTNLTITLVKSVIYHGGMGQLPESMKVIHLSVDDPNRMVAAIEHSRLGIVS